MDGVRATEIREKVKTRTFLTNQIPKGAPPAKAKRLQSVAAMRIEVEQVLRAMSPGRNCGRLNVCIIPRGN